MKLSPIPKTVFFFFQKYIYILLQPHSKGYNTWTIFFKLGTSIPFFQKLGCLVGQNNPIIFNPISGCVNGVVHPSPPPRFPKSMVFIWFYIYNELCGSHLRVCTLSICCVQAQILHFDQQFLKVGYLLILKAGSSLHSRQRARCDLV